jgi:putative ABC transport system permease protein
MKLFRLVTHFLRRNRRESELAREIEHHRALRQEALERAGLSARDAAAASRRALGNVSLACDDAREIWTSSSIERLWQDARYGARALRKNPAFTLVAIVTLALGIGSNAAMFSVVNAVLLKPLPYHDPDRLVMIWTADPKRDIHEAPTSIPTFIDWRNDGRSFADMAFWRVHSGNLTGGAEPERVAGAFASSNLFALLGVAPALGRTFTADEERRREPVVVLSHRLRQRRFGSDTSVIGQTITLDGHRLQVIGVMPEHFYFPTRDVQHWEPSTLMIPFASKPVVAERSWSDRFADFWHVAGRLRPDVTIREAQAEMTAIGQRLAEAYPTNSPDVVGFGVEVVPMLAQITGRNLRRALWILVGAVGLVLLIACANVANLLLARSAARNREFAVRAALGAGPRRLVRQLLLESTMLGIAGGALGLLAARAGVPILAASAVGVPRTDEIALDWRVLAFTAALSLFVGLLFGTAPAWKLSRENPGDWLKDSGPSVTAGLRLRRARGFLVVVECTLAVALLAGAGVLIRSFLIVRGIAPGFATQHVLLARVHLPIPVSRDWRKQEWSTWQQINERIGSLPGVASVGGITNFLIAKNPEEAITIEGKTTVSDELRRTLVNTDDVTPGFFQAMGVPLVRGRFFTYQEQNAPLAIVNEAFVQRFFAGEDPIGRRFKEGGPAARDAWVTIVGVVGNMHRQGVERDPLPEFFFASSEPTMDVAVRTSVTPTQLAPAVRGAIRSVYGNATIVHITTVEDSVRALGAQRRFQTWLLTAFACLALLLSIVGVYSITHFFVAQRHHELGIRIALGASRQDLLRLVLREGMRLPALGLVLGLGMAVALTRILGHLLFEVSPTDPITFTAVAAVLVAAALAACWLPARRASRIDPVVALKGE